MTDPLRAERKASTRTIYLFSGIAVAAAMFAGCSMLDQDNPDVLMPPEVVDVSNVPNATPVQLPLSKYGNPTSYVVAGKRYYTMPVSTGYTETGIASWYGTESQGKRTSSGETYDNYGMTAAHRTLPLPSFVTVTNKQNGRSVIVKINDRGPFHNNRLIELSYAAAVKLGIVGYGTGLVEVTSINPDDYGQEPEQILREASRELYLQAGAFRVRKNAENQRADIVAKGLGPARIIEPSLTTSLYAVQVGPFKDVTEAEQVASALKPMGINAVTHYEGDTVGTTRVEPPAMQTSTAEPRPAASMPEAVEMETGVAAVTEPMPETSEPDVVAMATDAAEAEAGTSKWKFWQGRKASVPVEATADMVTAAQESMPEASMPVEAATNLVTMAEEPMPATSEPEVVAMAADAAEADAAPSKWKFWQGRKAGVEPEQSMPVEATTNLVSEAAEPMPASSEPEVVAMATDAAEADAAPSKWKFWQGRKTKVEPEVSMPVEATADLVTAAEESMPEASTPVVSATNLVSAAEETMPETSEPEVVALATDATEPGAEAGKSKWKFWQWRKAGVEPEAGMPVAPAKDTVTADGEEEPGASKPEVMAMATTPAAPEPVQADVQDDASAVYMQTGAFRLRENAERLRPDVEALAPGAFSVIETSGARTLYKIEIGPLRDTAEAMRVKRELKTVGINPKIVDSRASTSMMASTKTYSTQPVRYIEQAAAPVEKSVAMARETVAPAPVEYKYATPEPTTVRETVAPAPMEYKYATAEPTTPDTRPAVAVAEKPVEQMRAAIPAARAEPASVAPGKKMLYQQAGAFARSNNATRLRTKIVDQTMEPTEIVQEPTELDRGLVTLHKVQVGPLQDKTEAMNVKRSLIPLGVTDSFPVYRQK